MRRRRLACVRAIAWSIESDIDVFEETCGERVYRYVFTHLQKPLPRHWRRALLVAANHNSRLGTTDAGKANGY